MHEPPTGHAPNECVAEPHSFRSQNCSWHLQHVCFPGRYLEGARGGRGWWRAGGGRAERWAGRMRRCCYLLVPFCFFFLFFFLEKKGAAKIGARLGPKYCRSLLAHEASRQP